MITLLCSNLTYWEWDSVPLGRDILDLIKSSLETFKAPGISPQRGKRGSCSVLQADGWNSLEWGNIQLSYLKNTSSNVLVSCLCVYARTCWSHTASWLNNEREAVGSPLEPRFTYHMIRALVMAIMMAVVVADWKVMTDSGRAAVYCHWGGIN